MTTNDPLKWLSFVCNCIGAILLMMWVPLPCFHPATRQKSRRDVNRRACYFQGDRPLAEA